MFVAHAADEHPKRLFHSIIFAGRDDYHEQVALLHKQVDEALTIISGLQQPDHSESEAHAAECAADRKRHEEDLTLLAHDILAALGFRADGLLGT